MAWISADCPVVDQEREWIDEELDWLADRFGSTWLYRPVVLPTEEFFPDTYGGEESVEFLERPALMLVATTAHELAHERLLVEAEVDPDRADQEPLADLLTVYLGLGGFTANAALDRETWLEPGQLRPRQRSRVSRQGYLTEPMFGYALARYSWLRGETDPDWADYVDTNPRTFLRQGLRYLERSEPEPDDIVSPVVEA